VNPVLLQKGTTKVGVPFVSVCQPPMLSTPMRAVSTLDSSVELLWLNGLQLALFGLGAIRDARLNRMFKQGKVKFSRPADDADVRVPHSSASSFNGQCTIDDSLNVKRVCVYFASTCRAGLTCSSSIKTVMTLGVARTTVFLRKSCQNFWYPVTVVTFPCCSWH
jgi:hypothetical protein